MGRLHSKRGAYSQERNHAGSDLKGVLPKPKKRARRARSTLKNWVNIGGTRSPSAFVRPWTAILDLGNTPQSMKYEVTDTQECG